MLITPGICFFKDVTHITPEWLAAKGITALVLDIDNTLTADRSQELPEEVAAWLDTMCKAGVKPDHRLQRCGKAGAPPLPKSWALPTCTAQPNPCPLR